MTSQNNALRFSEWIRPVIWNYFLLSETLHQLLLLLFLLLGVSRIRTSDLIQFRITSKLWSLLDMFVGLLWRGIGPSQGLYLHRTAQHKKMRAYFHTWAGFEPSAAMLEWFKITRVLERAAIGMWTSFSIVLNCSPLLWGKITNYKYLTTRN
jgi:hypothetical protein